MERQEQVRLLKTLMSRLDSGTTVDAGGLRKNPTSVYTDPRMAQQEWERFFLARPQIIGMTADLPAPGTFLTNNDLGSPILATRGEDGRFRAFLNVCRHRGVTVEGRERGSASRFSCPFHAWTYDAEGALVGLPKSDHFGEVDRECNSLVPLPAAELHGFLVVHPSPDGEIDEHDVFGGLGPEFDSWRFDELVAAPGDAYDMRLNWKLAMDTFGETYHFPVLHRDTLAADFHGNVQCYDTFGRNHRMILCRRSIDLMRDLPEDQWRIAMGALPVYWLFPNIQVLPIADGLVNVRVYPAPGQPGRSISKIDFYFRDHGDGAGDADLARARARGFAEVIQREDYVAAESSQVGAESGHIEHAIFGRNEPALHHYHNTYRSELGLDPLPLLDRA